MAGMLVPQLTLLPAAAWMAVFGTGAAWFGACALRSRDQSRFSWQCRYPVPHLIECIAMLYMLLAVRGAQQETGMAMPGMGTSPSPPAGFPALAVVLALFMLGYIMWTTDQLASLARAKTSTRPRPEPSASGPGHRSSGRPAATTAGAADAQTPQGCRTASPPPVRHSSHPARRVRQDRDGHHHGLHVILML